MSQTHSILNDANVMVMTPTGQSGLVVVCEHASCYIPEPFDGLGLAHNALQSHAAWDPGALAVAKALAVHVEGALVASTVSRLVYDCNRPPSAIDAMPAQSEAISVPGNNNLTQAQRQNRAETYYEPFRAALAQSIAQTRDAGLAPVIVTIHSFTPVYHGEVRAVEIGILHDTDTRLADAMLHIAPQHTDRLVLRNAPYGPEHGVTHTLKEHAIGAGHLNVMLEIRNDLITDAKQQDEMANSIAIWLAEALLYLDAKRGA